MKVLLIRRHRAYGFIDDFAAAMRAHGATTRVVDAEPLEPFAHAIADFDPDVFFCVGMHPFLSKLIAGRRPVAYFELDRVLASAFFDTFVPGAQDMVFCTYRDDLEPFRRVGVPHVEYLPFCPNARIAPDPPALTHDVSFVGSGLRSEQNELVWYLNMARDLVTRAPQLAPALQRIEAGMEAILAEQAEATDRGEFVVPRLVAHRCAGSFGDDLRAFRLAPHAAIEMLAKEAAHRQRAAWLAAVPGVSLFGPHDWSGAVEGARYCGTCDPYTESPRVFSQSRINLHIQRIYAQDGLSDRVFNVLASGGFLLADRNRALLDLFEDGRELVTFSSARELREKVDYYLSHEDERLAIARQGRIAVAERHSQVIRMGHILGRVRERMGPR